MTHPFSSTILAWYAQNGRQLPWRGSGDPYAVWLSEIILQQTRIAQGTDYYLRFMATWPPVEQLAAATQDEVLRLWQGLGYYSRARHLHEAAQIIAARGSFPDTYDAIRRLPGVGDYTAAAIASMAFGLPHAAVDGNVYRVLSRHFGIATPIDTTAGKHEFQALANELCPPHEAGTWNQAMMDFGAIQCTPTSPRCTDCPLQESCFALREGSIDSLPVKLKKVKQRTRYFTYYYIRCGHKTAIRQRGAGDIWQGLWEPVLLETDHPTPGVATLKHVLTHQTIFAHMVEMSFPRTQESMPQPARLLDIETLPNDYRWIDEHELEQYAVPRLVQRLLKEKRIFKRVKQEKG